MALDNQTTLPLGVLGGQPQDALQATWAANWQPPCLTPRNLERRMASAGPQTMLKRVWESLGPWPERTLLARENAPAGYGKVSSPSQQGLHT